MNKATITIAVFIVVGVGLLLIWRSAGLEVFNNPVESNEEVVVEEEETPVSGGEGLVPMISEEDLALHNSKDDCWVSYGGSVYDITDWVGKHPGGMEAIISVCGESTKFEEALNAQHGEDRAEMLPKVGSFIGTLGVIEGAQS